MKTSNLTGTELDRWVAKIEGTLGYHDIDRCDGDAYYSYCKNCGDGGGDGSGIWEWDFDDPPLTGCEKPRRYSTHWSQGGPLIEKYRIDLSSAIEVDTNKEIWIAEVATIGHKFIAADPLIAAMRAIVASVYGENIDE